MSKSKSGKSGKYEKIKEVTEFAYELTDHLGGEPRRNPVNPQCEMTIPNGAPDSLKEELATCGSLPPNPTDWNERDIHKWLKQKGLESLHQKLIHDLEIKDGTSLLDKLQDKVHDFGGDHASQREQSQIERLFKEVCKLQLMVYKHQEDEKTSLYDVTEMKRRIHSFVHKWDNILWIQHYEDINNNTPTKETIALELGLSMPSSQIYLEYYNNINRYKKKDLDELFCNFDVYNDCVIWWYLIITSLKSYPSKALWLIFARIALITPHKISLCLLSKYQQDLTRFDANELDKVTQKIVIGSQYPICTALAIAKWFQDRATLDVARAELFMKAAETYIQSALNYLNIVESDHLATILLEVKSDINNMSALDMALCYELTSFITNDTVERITTSIMNDWEFLRPKNKETSFEINPLSLTLIWDKLYNKKASYKVFYFTPLGQFTVQVFLYILYLILFTSLSFSGFNVFAPLGESEILFWIFNGGYVLYEVMQYGSKPSEYFSHTSNRFDFLISIVFICSFSIRMASAHKGAPCNDEIPQHIDHDGEVDDSLHVPCWYGSAENIIFTMLWVIATITLYLRLLLFCVLSNTLGPMVRIIFNMKTDIFTFFAIMFCVFIGFMIALMFLNKDLHGDFEDAGASILTLFMALLGEFDFEGFVEPTPETDILLGIAHIFVIFYLIVASLVLLNILIAMMAKTFDTTYDDATSTIIFSKFELALELNRSTNFIPPPLNVVGYAFIVIFYAIEVPVNWLRLLLFHLCKCCHNQTEFQVLDLSLYLMPGFMRKRKLGIDAQIESDEYDWTIKTNAGGRKCKVIKYDPEKMKHTVVFEEDLEKQDQGKVSIMPDILKQRTWTLDLLDMATNEEHPDTLELKQFNKPIDQKWINMAHKDMVSRWWRCMSFNFSEEESTNPQYWICGFCKSTVKQSRVSIMRLGQELNLSTIEMNTVRKAGPILCPHCYRVRLDCGRFQLVSEILSYWIFCFLVGPLLVILFGFLYHLDSLCQHKTKIYDLLPTETKTCTNYYHDTKLIKYLGKQSEEDHLFDEKEDHLLDKDKEVWSYLEETRESIDPVQLRNNINAHMVEITTDVPLTELAFREQFLGIHSLSRLPQFQQIEALSQAIFRKIVENDPPDIALHLFRKYPLSASALLDNLHETWRKCKHGIEDEKSEEEAPIHLIDCDVKLEQFVAVLNRMDDLNDYFRPSADKEEKEFVDDYFRHPLAQNERAFVMDCIVASERYEHETSIYRKFVKYMHDVEALLQNDQKIKTLLRDIKFAMDEGGIDLFTSSEELLFLCQDLNEVLVIPLFNTMMRICKETKRCVGGDKLYLWDIRNNLMAIDYVQRTVKDQLLRKHVTIKITRDELVELVLKKFADDILDDEDEDTTDEKDDSQISALARSATRSRYRLYDDNHASEVAIEPDTQRLQSQVHGLVETWSRAFHVRSAMAPPSKLESNTKAFLKSKIKKNTLVEIIHAIFKDLKKKYKAKPTATAIHSYYITKMVPLEETLQFIYEQLARYTKFFPKRLQQPCTEDDFVKILRRTKFQKCKIDDETIPRQLVNEFPNRGGKKPNNALITDLYNHYVRVHEAATNNADHQVRPTVQNMFTMAMLYNRIYQKVRQDILDITVKNRVDHYDFIHFVNPEFKKDKEEDRSKWSRKSNIAYDLFHCVLWTQKDIVSLGQARATIDKLISQINNMGCGGIIRLTNHLKTRINQDKEKLLYKTNSKMMDASAGKQHRHPRLNRKHYNDKKWQKFVDDISKQVHRCFGRSGCSICDIGKYGDEDEKKEQKHVFILDEDEHSITDLPKCETWMAQFEQEEQQHNTVFNTVLSFSRDSITIQQLYQFSVKFARLLKDNAEIKGIMKQYHEKKEIQKREKHDQQIGCSLVRLTNSMAWLSKKLPPRQEFMNTYFPRFLSEFDMAISWLYDTAETNGDLCNNINIFWSVQSSSVNNMILKIYDFMQNAQHVDGSYILNPEQFSLWKLDLKITEESIKKLFNIVRGHTRTLSLHQFYHYFTFLLRMKYHAQDAILRSDQREDTPVSQKGLKIELKISSDAESEWLFKKIDVKVEGELTWKQITQYLQKTLHLRKNMKDFFHEKDIENEYEDKKVQMMTTMTEEQKDILKQLETITSHVAPKDSLQQLRGVFSENAKNGKLTASDFERAIHSLSIHCIKKENITSLFTYLVSQQTKNRIFVSMAQSELQIDPFMNKIKLAVPNHANLTPKQMCLSAMDEFMHKAEISAMDLDTNPVANALSIPLTLNQHIHSRSDDFSHASFDPNDDSND
eukprot:990764_1